MIKRSQNINLPPEGHGRFGIFEILFVVNFESYLVAGSLVGSSFYGGEGSLANFELD